MKKFSVFARARMQEIINKVFWVGIGLFLMNVARITYQKFHFVFTTGFETIFLWLIISVYTIVGIVLFYFSILIIIENTSFLWRHRSDIYEK